MNKYVVIKTAYANYKCHAYRIKAGRVYFNSRAVNLANVISITGKEGEVLYENSEVKQVINRRSKAPVKETTRLARERKPSKKSSLPDVIEL